MPTATRALRRGLPRDPGADAWPPPGLIEVPVGADFLAETADTVPAVPAVPAVLAVPAAPASRTPRPSEPAAPDPAPEPADGGVDLPATVTIEREVALRRGLPRTSGGEPWPAAGLGLRTVAADAAELDWSGPDRERVDTPVGVSAPPIAVVTSAVGPSVGPGPGRVVDVPLRRGLPRAAGGDPWPPAGHAWRTVAVDAFDLAGTADWTEPEDAEPSAAGPAPVAETPEAPDPTPSAAPRPAVRPPAAATTRTLAPSPAPRKRLDPAALVAKAALALRFPAAAFVVAVALVGALLMAARWLTGTEVGEAFLLRYPGTYALPAAAEPGFPAWVRWNHFLNLLFIILIIRSGLQVRHEKRPPAYVTPRRPHGAGKISISLWLHQTLDLLWLLNGVAFVITLFLTPHWMRIVPTSWDVFPNAVSAALQYASLDWPTEHGWVAYNSLQQLAYFTVVFVAAPLAAATGVRMSAFWPAKARRLSKLYPVELARALHYPTMLFFVVFVIMHVAMVFATGALRNLNHMFAGTDATSWTGFWILVAALALVATLWELARPLLLTSVAQLFGTVSQR